MSTDLTRKPAIYLGAANRTIVNESIQNFWLPLIYFIISDAIFPPANLHGDLSSRFANISFSKQK